MRIALDARTLFRPQRRGTGKNLVDLYRSLALIRPDWHVTAFHRQPRDLPQLLPPTWCEPRLIEMPGDCINAWERWRLPMAARRSGADVLHCPSNTCPDWMPIDTVVTIHDLIPLDRPDERSIDELRQFTRSIHAACRHAAWIITPSRYTRNRLVGEFGADASRITVNPWAADSAIRRVPDDLWKPVLDRYGITRPFVLHLGAADPRKNTMGVIEAWAELDPVLRAEWKLLIVGLDAHAMNNVIAFAELRGVASEIILKGFAPEADLRTLMSAAGLLAFPSLSEGFGLPILDAWVTQTPVLTSNTTSMPEVAGDAALLVNPAEIGDISRGLARLMTDSQLRNSLVKLGDLRRLEFTWEATARGFAETVESVQSRRSSLRGAA